MQKILALILVIVMVFSLASCSFISGTTTTTTLPTTQPTTTTTTTTTTPTTTKPNPSDESLYNAFTPAEKKLFEDYFGIVIPFLPNDEYYVEEYEFEYEEGTNEIGLNYYVWGKTEAEFNAYKSKIDALLDFEETFEDDYGDTWYTYVVSDEAYLDIAYYETEEDGYIVDIYVYYYSTTGGSGSDSGSTDTDHIYTDFTDEEKDLFREYADTSIPFIANDDYGVEEYSNSYDDGQVEYGVNFYTYGNTQAEFDYYKSVLDFFYTFDYSYEDDEGDTWYSYTVDYDVYLDVSYYYTAEGYVVDVYVYYLGDETSGGSGSGSGSGSTEDIYDDLFTNEGAGLPEGTNGVFNVDFRKADKFKNVTDMLDYIGGCPTTGSPAVLVIPVEFSDVTAQSKGYSIDVLTSAFEQGGDVDYYSVYDYYFISSYGQLTLDITVLDEWFRPQYDSSYYYNATYNKDGEEVLIGDQLIMDEALAYLEDKMDLTQFDSDDNGLIDSIVLINTLEIGREDFYWAYRDWNYYLDDNGSYYTYDDVRANDYIWASYQFLYEGYDEEGYIDYKDSSLKNTYTFIHEFGHVLGADDYYDYSGVESPLDNSDVMDSLTGDHNAYTKFNYGWLTTSRLVVTDSSVTLTLEDFSKNGDTIIIANNWDEKLGVYQEYYILMYYTNNGLNAGESYGYFDRDGVVVYHVNSSIALTDYKGEDYYFIHNSNTDSSYEGGYGTENNLIEFVKSANDTFTYIEGDTLPLGVELDNGEELAFTFVIDALTSECVTITFTAK